MSIAVSNNDLKQLLEEVIIDLEEELKKEVINPHIIRKAKLDLQMIESLSYIKGSTEWKKSES